MPFLALAGALMSAGKKPKIPDWKDVTMEDSARRAATINKSTLPDYMEIGSKVNTFNAGEIEKMLMAQFPEYHKVEGQFLGNLESGLRGELPKDVADMISRKSAERGVAGGFAGSGMGRNMTARDLGLSSLQLTQKSMDTAQTWLAKARDSSKTGMFDVTSQFVRPEQVFQSTMLNQENQYNTQLMKAKIAAMPDPKKAAIGQWMQQTDSAIFGTALSVGGAMLGGGGGGGGKGGGGGGAIYQSQNPNFDSYVAPQASPDYKFEY